MKNKINNEKNPKQLKNELKEIIDEIIKSTKEFNQESQELNKHNFNVMFIFFDKNTNWWKNNRYIGLYY